MLTACASPTKQVVPVMHSLHDLPANLAAPCSESQDLKNGTGAEVLSLMIDDRRKLVDCRQKHGAIVDLWREIQDKTKALN